MSSTEPSSSPPTSGNDSQAASSRRLALMIGALGVVFGDIGTSPLYTIRECFSGPHSVAASPDHILGVISLVFWSLALVVSIKYLALVMRADNNGEGGILALLAMAVSRKDGDRKNPSKFLLLVGVFGACLLYGDGMITPAVTVLSAVEGLEVATPLFQPFVVPIAVVILVLLFSVQRLGTHRVGSVFGPVMLAWFAALAILGIRGIISQPEILRAVNPRYGLEFLLGNGSRAFLVLGSVFLCVTGAEALYADMGHFGAPPIRRAWFALVFPALLLNYFGEGALLLRAPEAARNPFFLLAPPWAVLPLVGLATIAAVIASQALISGAYSLTMQAIQMGYLPRLQILHTSREERGQIYMPQVNLFLMLSCVGLVVGFKSSSNLAGAYGIAVSLTMLITTVLFFAAARNIWKWNLWLAIGVCSLFAAIDAAFVSANALKILQGGWFPLLIGLMMFSQMVTWKTGRSMLRAKLADSYLPFEMFLKDLESHSLHRVPGTAVFLSGNPKGTPIALLHNIRHNKILHQRIVLLTVSVSQTPNVPDAQRLNVEQLRPDIYRVTGQYGFMEQPNVPALLAACEPHNLRLDPNQTTFFLSRETIVPERGPGMAQWRKRAFARMARNSQSAAAFFRLPPNRVVELGMQIEF